MAQTSMSSPMLGEVTRSASRTRTSPTTPCLTERFAMSTWVSSAAACCAIGAPLPMAWKPMSSYRPVMPLGVISTIHGPSSLQPAASTYADGPPFIASPGTSAMKCS
jgi:hypothetical protein